MNTIWRTFFGIRDNIEDIRGPANLSEDACGNLVHSLVRLGYLSSIATSLDGRSFITHEQLTKDIFLQLEKRQGRVSLLDLPKVLNAQLSDIQECVQELIRSKPTTLLQVQDELLQAEYLDTMVSQLNEELARQGYFSIMESCRKFKFNIDFMRQFLKDRVGRAISGQWDTVDRGLVVSPSFLEKEKMALLKALSDLKEPTSLQSLRSMNVVQSQLFYGLCDLLSKESGVRNTLPGVFKGTNEQGQFEPSSYEQQQTEWIETFFKDNGFIELGAVRKRGIIDPKAYLRSNHPSALILETHAVKDSIWSIVDASVEDAISNLSWIDVKPLLPTPFTKDDISSLLRQLPSLMEPTSRIVISPEQDPSMTGFGGGLPQETFVIHDSIVVTSGQLQKCLMKMGPLLDRSLENLVSWRLSFGDNQQLCGQDDQDDYEPYFAGQGNSHSSLKGFVEHAMSALDSLKKNNSHHTKASLQGGRKKDGPNNKRIQDFLTIQDIKKEVERLEPDFDPALINMIAKVLNGDLIQNLRDRNRSIVLDQVQGEEKDEEIEAKNTSGNKAVSSAIASLSKRIELSSQGIDVFEDDSARNSLSKYLLQSLSVELLDLVTLYTANLNKAASSASELAETLKLVNQSFMKYHCQADVTPSSNTAQVPFSLSAEEASLLVELVPQKVSDTLKKMRRSTAGSGKQKNLTEYLGLWSSLRKDLGFELNTTATDQLNDSLFLAEHMKGLRKVLQEITSSIDHALMLHIVALIAFQKWTGHMLHASGKYVPRVIRQLRVSIEMSSGDSTAKEQLDVLEKALEAILSNVKQQQLHSSEGQDPSNKQMEIDRLLKDTRNLGLSLSSPIL